MALPRMALILFDHDGFSTIVQTKRLYGTKTLTKATRCLVNFDGKPFSIEILELSDNEDYLDEQDSEWSSTHRAGAIQAERDRRQEGRSRKIYGGYLDIWPSDQPSEVSTTHTTVTIEQTTQRSNKRKRKNQDSSEPELTEESAQRENSSSDTQPCTASCGSSIEGNGRSVQVLFEGGGDLDGIQSTPRSPGFVDGLNSDECDLLHNQVTNYIQQKRTMGTQTDHAIVISSTDDMLQLGVISEDDSNGKEIKKWQGSINKRLSTIEKKLGGLDSKFEQLMEVVSNLNSTLTNQSASETLNNQRAQHHDVGPIETSDQLSLIESTSQVPSSDHLTTSTCRPSSDHSTTTASRSSPDNMSTSTSGTYDCSSTSATIPSSDESTTSASRPSSDLLTTSASKASSDKSTISDSGPSPSHSNPSTSAQSSDQSTKSASAQSLDNSTSSASPQLSSNPSTTSVSSQSSDESTTSMDPHCRVPQSEVIASQAEFVNNSNEFTTTDSSESSVPTISSLEDSSSVIRPDNSSQNHEISSYTDTAFDNILLDPEPTTESNNCAVSVPASSTPNHLDDIDEVIKQLSQAIECSEGQSQENAQSLETCTTEPTVNDTSKENDVISNVFNSHNNMSLASDSISLHCPCNVETVHISSHHDCREGNLEFRIRPDVMTQCATANQSSEGNFLWSLTKMLYLPSELIGRNFSGRKGRKMLSPRRKHALIHAYVDSFGRNKNRFMKATSSVNSGIRYLSLKEKCKE